jgi:hypothetical protein
VNVGPAKTYEAVFEAGIAGLAGTVALGLLDNVGGFTQALSTAGIIETPAGSGIYAATRISPAVEGQYTLLWSLDGSTDVGQVSTEDLVVTSSSYTFTGAYASVEDLQLLLRIDSPTAAQVKGMQRVLDMAAEEINSELGYSVDRPAPSPVPPLVVGVNLDRAVEHWRQSFSPFGVIGVGSEGEPVLTARNSWYRHHLKLAPLKTLRGVA